MKNTDAEAPRPVPSLEGIRLGKYDVREVLGEGGMGVVHRAYDTALERDVALKVLSPSLGNDLKARARFLLEARAAGAIDHGNVCTIHEADTTPDGTLYIAMALYKGETLKERLTRGRCTLEECLDWTLQACSGLEQVHDAGIIHRDLTPGNLLRTEHGVVKLLDFGIAKLVEDSFTSGPAAFGAVRYMPPEQLEGNARRPQVDIWSMGVLMYEMLSGQPPFVGDDAVKVISQVLRDDPAPLASVVTGLPEPVSAGVMQALQKDPNARPSSVHEFLCRLTLR